jgi:Arc/MetJ-type ribon-helix-helix transcriptional regulator
MKMSDVTDDEPRHPDPEMIEVTFRVPARLLADYQEGVRSGYYAGIDEALRHGLVESWRHNQGRYSTLRIDLRDPEDKRPDNEPRPQVDDVLAASDALQDEEHANSDAGSSDGDGAT